MPKHCNHKSTAGQPVQPILACRQPDGGIVRLFADVHVLIPEGDPAPEIVLVMRPDRTVACLRSASSKRDRRAP